MKILDELDRHVEQGRKLYVGPISEHMGFLDYGKKALPALIRVARAADALVREEQAGDPARADQANRTLRKALQELRDLGGGE